MEDRKAPKYQEGPRSRITHNVKFTGMYHYIGRNHFCRVELVPSLGHAQVNPDGRYITLPPRKLWYLWLAQSGYYYKVTNPLERQRIQENIIPAAFQWRKCRTNGLWLCHPLDVPDYHREGEPFAIQTDYIHKTEETIYREQGFVYIIWAAGLNRVRIGWTIDLKRRPQELIRSSPVALEFWAILPGTREDETDLQVRFAHLRTHHDWFEAAEDLCEYVEWAKKYWRKPGEYPFRWFSEMQLPIDEKGIRRRV